MVPSKAVLVHHSHTVQRRFTSVPPTSEMLQGSCASPNASQRVGRLSAWVLKSSTRSATPVSAILMVHADMRTVMRL
jgi:hypothetical protein